MITALTGILKHIAEDRIGLSVGPLVIELLIPAADVPLLEGREDEEITFHTSMYIEGDMSGGAAVPRIIGFLRPSDRDFFHQFITVKGIGPKKALKLIQDHGTAKNVIANADKLSGKLAECVKAFAPKYELTRQLVTLRKDTPIEFDLRDCDTSRLRLTRLQAVFEELGFTRLKDQLAALLAERGDTAQPDDTVPVAKPAPDLFLSAADCLGVAPAACLVFEDSPNGILAARAAGMRCVVVPGAITSRLTLPPADLVLASLDALPLDEIVARVSSTPL